MSNETDWELERVTFHHDVLKNRFLSRFAAFLLRLDQSEPAARHVAAFVHDELPAWPEHSATARRLAKTFAAEMSPGVYLASGIMERLDSDTREWMTVVADSCWKSAYPVDAWVAATVTAIDEADACYALVAPLLDSTPGVDELRAAKAQMEMLYARCLEVSRALSMFPHDAMLP
jgi:hypothetical protein